MQKAVIRKLLLRGELLARVEALNYVFSLESLLKSIWDNNAQTDNRHIRNIRNKLITKEK